MSCNITIEALDYNCDDKTVGSLKQIKVGNLANYATLKESAVNHEIAAIPAGNGAIAIEFNSKDSFTSFTEEKTVDPAGSSSTVPTITVEVPIMNKAHRKAIEALCTPNAELIVFAEMANGEFIVVGGEFGMYGASASGTSGASRADKNAYQLTLTGEESGMCDFIGGADYASKKAIFDAI